MRCRLRVDEGHGHSTAERSKQVDSHFACSQVRMRKYLDYRRVSCHLVSGRYMYENETKLCCWTVTFYITIPMWWPCIAISISHEFFGSFHYGSRLCLVLHKTLISTYFTKKPTQNSKMMCDPSKTLYRNRRWEFSCQLSLLQKSAFSSGVNLTLLLFNPSPSDITFLLNTFSFGQFHTLV